MPWVTLGVLLSRDITAIKKPFSAIRISASFQVCAYVPGWCSCSGRKVMVSLSKALHYTI